MFWNKRSEEKQVDIIRKKWRDYRVPPEARTKSLDIVRPFAQASLTLVNFIGIRKHSKANRYEEEFTRMVGLLSHDCFLIGMEFGELKISDEVRELLSFVCEPLIKFMQQIIIESIEMGAAPRQDRDRIIRTTLEQIVNISIQSYEICVSHNPRHVAYLQKMNNAALGTFTNQIQDKIRYLFAHVYLPNSLFELPQKTYETLVSGKGRVYLLNIWNRIAAKTASKVPPIGLNLFREKLDSNHEVFVIQMPKPEVVPEAFFGAMVFKLDYFTLSPKVTAVRYFTLEMGKNPYEQVNEYHFCEWVTSKEHLNFGRLSRNDKNLFLQAIFSVINSKTNMH
jgi:hypothetical protein